MKVHFAADIQSNFIPATVNRKIRFSHSPTTKHFIGVTEDKILKNSPRKAQRSPSLQVDYFIDLRIYSSHTNARCFKEERGAALNRFGRAERRVEVQNPR